MFLLTRFMQHFFSLVIHSLSLRGSTSGAALVLLFDNIARYRHDIVVALADLLINLRYSQASSTSAVDNADFPE